MRSVQPGMKNARRSVGQLSASKKGAVWSTYSQSTYACPNKRTEDGARGNEGVVNRPQSEIEMVRLAGTGRWLAYTGSKTCCMLTCHIASSFERQATPHTNKNASPRIALRTSHFALDSASQASGTVSALGSLCLLPTPRDGLKSKPII